MVHPVYGVPVALAPLHPTIWITSAQMDRTNLTDWSTSVQMDQTGPNVWSSLLSTELTDGRKPSPVACIGPVGDHQQTFIAPVDRRLATTYIAGSTPVMVVESTGLVKGQQGPV